MCRLLHATGSHPYPKRSYYDILGVSEDARQDEIKKAFHVLAKKYHPDAHNNDPSAKRKFQKIRDAYEMPVEEKNFHRFSLVVWMSDTLGVTILLSCLFN